LFVGMCVMLWASVIDHVHFVGFLGYPRE